ncbi:MAG: enolase C-terminal domain-like protein [Pseudomonadota bacterium]|nr:enolase C-terminal domain-like protein [Pseudomonadota bacterium]
MQIESVQARTVNVPLTRPLVTGGGSVGVAPLVLIDVQSDNVLVGRSYVFAVSPLLAPAVASLVEQVGSILVGCDLRPRAIYQTMTRRLRLAGLDGLAGWAVAGIDMAVWDLHAKAMEEPLYRVLGGAAGPIPAYNSNGLGLIGADAAAVEALELAQGFGGVKVRLGYETVEEDVAVLEAVREAVPEDVAVMCDYNQCLSRAGAKERIAAIDEMGLAWIEEPLSADDIDGYADLRGWTTTPVQLGENARNARDILRLIEREACDLLMPDVAKIGGVTPWLRAAEICAAAEVPISTHLFPEVSVHLMAVSPTAHWLEFVDWAAPVLKDPLVAADGYVMPPDRPGSGIEWNEDAVARYRTL